MAAALSLVLAACGGAPPQASEDADDRAAAEQAAPPAYPRDSELVEFSVPNAGSMRFFVDAPSLSVVGGKDGVVRFTLVARSAEGARNVSYEGLRCTSAHYRVYALGRSDGSWSGRPTEWRAINDAWRRALYRQYFCPLNEPIRSADEGLSALRSGGHPFAKGFGS